MSMVTVASNDKKLGLCCRMSTATRAIHDYAVSNIPYGNTFSTVLKPIALLGEREREHSNREQNNPPITMIPNHRFYAFLLILGLVLVALVSLAIYCERTICKNKRMYPSHGLFRGFGLRRRCRYSMFKTGTLHRIQTIKSIYPVTMVSLIVTVHCIEAVKMWKHYRALQRYPVMHTNVMRYICDWIGHV
jgi:hypothetical protein